MHLKTIFANSSFSVIHIIINSFTLFFLYRFLLSTIGVELLGIWSLVLATTSVTGIAQLGLSGSVVKFVAKYKAHDDPKKVATIIETAFISVSLLFAVVLLAFFPFARKILLFIVDYHYHVNALFLLPFALISIWLTSLSGVIQSGIDGCQRIASRSIITSACSVLYFLFCLWVVPKYGLHGLAFAQIMHAVILLLFYYILLKHILPRLPLIPITWDWPCFKEIYLYGANFQLITLMSMLLDPLTKTLISKFGGAGFVGYYEMAYKLISHARSLIIAANSVIVPAIAHQVEKFPTDISRYYIYNLRILISFSFPVFTSLIFLSPMISMIWIGHQEVTFIYFLIILSLGWLLNTLAAPAYFFFLGAGKLKWNLVSHAAIAILNLLLGLPLGFYFGSIGVVLANSIALVIGGWITLHNYHFLNNFSYKHSFSCHDVLYLIIYSMFIIAAILGLFWNPTLLSSMPLTACALLILLSLSLYLFYKNPNNQKLLTLFKNQLSTKGA